MMYTVYDIVKWEETEARLKEERIRLISQVEEIQALLTQNKKHLFGIQSKIERTKRQIKQHQENLNES